MDKNDNKIIVFPDYQKLKDTVEKMKTELSMLLLERDELQFIICRNIETLYYLKLGALEHRAYKAECDALRLRRKIALVQAKINRQEKVILPLIEEILDREFADYRRRLQEQIEKMNEALERSRLPILNEEERKELRTIYRKVVKCLHPDLNPDVTEAHIQLFVNAVEAYKNGDLEGLRLIELMAVNTELPENTRDAMSVLANENARLEKVIAAIREDIIKIKNEYPYTVKDIVEDAEKEQKRREELENFLRHYEELIDIYKKKLQEMLRRIS